MFQFLLEKKTSSEWLLVLVVGAPSIYYLIDVSFWAFPLDPHDIKRHFPSRQKQSMMNNFQDQKKFERTDDGVV